jgi:hypothetical protein
VSPTTPAWNGTVRSMSPDRAPIRLDVTANEAMYRAERLVRQHDPKEQGAVTDHGGAGTGRVQPIGIR